MFEKIIIDGVHWYISSSRQVQPLCPIHNLRLTKDTSRRRIIIYSDILLCADCPDKNYPLPRMYDKQIQYVLDKFDSKSFKNMKIINLDDEAIPLAETKLPSKDEKYFITALLTKSKVGLRLIIYAGEKGSSEKSQIFIEPEIKRLSFDQKNLHPTDVFAKVEATFKDGTKHILSGSDRDASI